MASKLERQEQKRAQAALKRQKREEARGEIIEARMRTGIGFGATYVVTQVLPAFMPSVSEYQGTVDLALAVGGIGLAVTDDGETGDYALGAGLVGATQTLDNVALAISKWLAK